MPADRRKLMAMRTPDAADILAARAALAAVGVSLRQAARAIGVAPSTISRWLSGRTRPTARQLAQLRIAAEELRALADRGIGPRGPGRPRGRTRRGVARQG